MNGPQSPTKKEPAQDLNVIELNQENFCEQNQSPLFSVLPGEIRDRIFAFALAEFEDTSKPFDNNTCYRRPEYAAPRRSDTALLRTCQRVYQEAFFYPFALAEQVLWLAWSERRPANITTVERLQPALVLMQKLHGDTELESVRMFAQLCELESGGKLGIILAMPHFFPRSMTITIRHTDIWSWDTDAPIRVGGHWTEICRFPNSIRTLNIQVESLERKRDQIDYIASQMIEQWRFTRNDNTTLQASPNSTTISRWTGSSTWGGQRWLRDETSPETLCYYIATIPFHPTPASELRPRLTQRDPQLGPMPGASPIPDPNPYRTTQQLAAAGVPPGLPAHEVDAICRQNFITRVAARQAARAQRIAAQSAARAHAQAQVERAYPHQQIQGESTSGGSGAQVLPAIITADTLRAARAVRRRQLANQEEDYGGRVARDAGADVDVDVDVDGGERGRGGPTWRAAAAQCPRTPPASFMFCRNPGRPQDRSREAEEDGAFVSFRL